MYEGEAKVYEVGWEGVWGGGEGVWGRMGRFMRGEVKVYEVGGEGV